MAQEKAAQVKLIQMSCYLGGASVFAIYSYSGLILGKHQGYFMNYNDCLIFRKTKTHQDHPFSILKTKNVINA